MTWVADLTGIKTVRSAGVPVTTRAALNFLGDGVTVADNAGDEQTDVTILTGATATAIYVTNLTALAGTVDRANIYCDGYSSRYDGGGGWFVWHAGSTTTADGGTVFGAGTGRWKRVFSGAVNVRWFGAMADGSDATAAIQATATYCATSGRPIQGSPGTYLVTSTITLLCAGDLSAMTLSANATSVSPVVRVGTTTGSGTLAQLRIDLILPKVSNSAKVTTGWAGFSTSVGIETANLYESRLTFPDVRGFGVGLLFAAYSAGNVYNEFRLGMMWNNKIQLQLGPLEVTGWVNENNFYGGRFGYDTSEGSTNAGAYSLYLAGTTGTGNVNNNVFYRPDLEGDEPQFHVYIRDASYNTILNPRFENPAGASRIKFESTVSGETNSNLIIGGYKDTQPAYTFTGDCPYNKWLGSRLNDALDYTGCGVSIVNRSGSGQAQPHIQGFEATEDALDKTAASTDWAYRLHGSGLSVKATGDSTARILLDSPTGSVYLGNGASTPTSFWRGTGTANELITNSLLYPTSDDTYGLGAAGSRWSSLHVTNIRPGTGVATWTSGALAPEGVVGAAVGSLYTHTGGGAGTTLYVKESGGGNTGWVAK